MKFAPRLDNVETSAIRNIFKVLGKPGIISFAGGFPDASLFDTQALSEASGRAIKNHPSLALQYGPTEGYGVLREQLCEHMKLTNGAKVDASHVVVTTGSQQAIDLLSKVLLSEGDHVLVEGPTFLSAIQCFRLYGAQVSSVPIDDEGLDVESLERYVQEKRPKLVYLIPTFSNPSGAVMSLERRKKVLELAVQYEFVVIEDNPYDELFFTEPAPQSLLTLAPSVEGSSDWLVYCGSLSKILSPGLRLGWLVGSEMVLHNVVKCKQFNDANSSMLAQLTASEYIGTGRLPYSIEKIRMAYAHRAQLMARCLKQYVPETVRFSQPKGGMFIWAKLTGVLEALTDATEFSQRCVQANVAVVPGMPFYATDPDVSTFRMSFATVPDEQIVEGVQRLAKAL